MMSRRVGGVPIAAKTGGVAGEILGTPLSGDVTKSGGKGKIAKTVARSSALRTEFEGPL